MLWEPRRLDKRSRRGGEKTDSQLIVDSEFREGPYELFQASSSRRVQMPYLAARILGTRASRAWSVRSSKKRSPSMPHGNYDSSDWHHSFIRRVKPLLTWEKQRRTFSALTVMKNSTTKRKESESVTMAAWNRPQILASHNQNLGATATRSADGAAVCFLCKQLGTRHKTLVGIRPKEKTTGTIVPKVL